jgi:predicted alpha/beta hydrolase family esterase
MKKSTILFIQGGGEGAYEEDKKLALYLQNALRKTHDVSYPKMPNENDPDYESYKTKIDKELKRIKGQLILVGHSLGSCYLLKYLSEEKIDKDIAGMFFIATPFWGGDKGWQYEGFRLDNKFASKLPASTPIFFYHSTDDEVVRFSHLALYSEKLPRATIRKIIDRGHQLKNDLSEVVRDIKDLSIQHSS